MNSDRLQELMQKAKDDGTDLKGLLEEELEEERGLVEDMIQVQIMPCQNIGGPYGGGPLAKVLMPKGKALDLAGQGKVSIISKPSDVIKEDDVDAIDAILKDNVEIRRTGDKKVSKVQKKSHLTNKKMPKEKVVIEEEEKEEPVIEKGGMKPKGNNGDKVTRRR